MPSSGNKIQNNENISNVYKFKKISENNVLQGSLQMKQNLSEFKNELFEQIERKQNKMKYLD